MRAIGDDEHVRGGDADEYYTTQDGDTGVMSAQFLSSHQFTSSHQFASSHQFVNSQQAWYNDEGDDRDLATFSYNPNPPASNNNTNTQTGFNDDGDILSQECVTSQYLFTSDMMLAEKGGGGGGEISSQLTFSVVSGITGPAASPSAGSLEVGGAEANQADDAHDPFVLRLELVGPNVCGSSGEMTVSATNTTTQYEFLSKLAPQYIELFATRRQRKKLLFGENFKTVVSSLFLAVSEVPLEHGQSLAMFKNGEHVLQVHHRGSFPESHRGAEGTYSPETTPESSSGTLFHRSTSTHDSE